MIYSDTSSILCGVSRVLGNGLVILTKLAEGQNDPPSSQWPRNLLMPLGNWEENREKGWGLLEVLS